jgi:RHS repeat-associated protein
VKDDSRTQSFSYDPLNRLLTAGDKTHWSNSYTYDAWGNLYQKVPGAPAGENMVKTADKNNRLSGMAYDAAGNVIVDDQGNTLVYDAENRAISVTNSLSGATTYTYDASGRRITKSNGATVTNYWFGPAGDILSETDSSGNFTHYIFFGGRRLARNVSGDIKYYITDHLHSTAVFADKSGTILDDNDFYPWGGVVPGVGATSSTNHYKFTGKERDTESGLDYFGARYYANASGRFMSPDWAAKPTNVPYAEFGDPQSLNLYSYVRNSPIVRVDADGHSYAGMNGFNADTTAGSPMATTTSMDLEKNPGSDSRDSGALEAAFRGVSATAAGASQAERGTKSVEAAMIFEFQHAMDNRRVQEESYKLFRLANFGHDEREHTMWLTWDIEYGVVPWPWSAQNSKDTWSGPLPPGAVAVIHDHPTDRDQRPSQPDHDLADRLRMPVFVLHQNGIWRADPGVKKDIPVRDYTWVNKFKP